MLISLLGIGLFCHGFYMAAPSGPEPHRPSTMLRYESCPDSRSIAAELDQQVGVSGCRWPDEWSFSLKWDEAGEQWRLDKIIDEQVLESSFIVGDCNEVEQAVIIQLKSDLLSSGVCGDDNSQEFSAIMGTTHAEIDGGPAQDHHEVTRKLKLKTRSEPHQAVSKAPTPPPRNPKKKPEMFLMLGAGIQYVEYDSISINVSGGFRTKFSRNLETGVGLQWVQSWHSKDSFDLRLGFPLCIWTAPRRWNTAFCVVGYGIYNQIHDPEISDIVAGGSSGSLGIPRFDLSDITVRQLGLGVGLDIPIEWVAHEKHRIMLNFNLFLTDFNGNTNRKYSQLLKAQAPNVKSLTVKAFVVSLPAISAGITLSWRYRL